MRIYANSSLNPLAKAVKKFVSFPNDITKRIAALAGHITKRGHKAITTPINDLAQLSKRVVVKTGMNLSNNKLARGISENKPKSIETQEQVLIYYNKYINKQGCLQTFKQYMTRKCQKGIHQFNYKTNLDIAIDHFMKIEEAARDSNSEGMRYAMKYLIQQNKEVYPEDITLKKVEAFLTPLMQEPAFKRYDDGQLQTMPYPLAKLHVLESLIGINSKFNQFIGDCYLLATPEQRKDFSLIKLNCIFKNDPFARKILTEKHPDLAKSYKKHSSIMAAIFNNVAGKLDTVYKGREKEELILLTRKYQAINKRDFDTLKQLNQRGHGHSHEALSLAYKYIEWIQENQPEGLSFENLKDVLGCEFTDSLYKPVNHIFRIINNIVMNDNFKILLTQCKTKSGYKSNRVLLLINKHFKDKLDLFKDEFILSKFLGEEDKYLIKQAFKRFEKFKILSRDPNFKKLKDNFFQGTRVKYDSVEVQRLVNTTWQGLEYVPNDIKTLMQTLKHYPDLIDTFIPDLSDKQKLNVVRFIDFLINAVDEHNKPSTVTRALTTLGMVLDFIDKTTVSISDATKLLTNALGNMNCDDGLVSALH